MSDKLKPCPFCGAHAKIQTLFDDFYIEIFEGRATRAIYATKQEAIAAWNRRVQPMFTPDELDVIARYMRQDFDGNGALERAILKKCNAALKGEAE